MNDSESILENVAEQFIASLRAGDAPSIESYAQQHPALSDDIYEILSSIELMEQLSRCESDSREQVQAQNVAPPIDHLGDFDIVREIGRGGMGVVYEAVDRTLQRRVALKVLNDSAFSSPKQIDRFRRESRLASQLHHTNIVPVFGIGQEDGKSFYAMQYVDGVSVEEIVESLNTSPIAKRESEIMRRDVGSMLVLMKERFSSSIANDCWQNVARLGIQVADALHYAHGKAILHRDIKPANLLVDANGTVWVADFGLAKLTDADDLTKTGDVVGTLKYMAPEQLAGKADARADVYALGLTLYELLTLRPVHDGTTYKEIFAQKQNANHVPPRKVNPAIPRDLDTIVQKALEFDVDKRYASARDVLEDLQRFIDDRPILARRVSLGERAWRWCRRNRLLASMAAMIVSLFVTLPIVLGWAYLREAERKEKSEQTMNVVLDGFDDLFRSYLDNDVAASSTLSASGDDSANLAPAMLSKDTAKVMEKMLLVYDRLAAQNPSSTDATLAVESAKARRRVGDLYRKLGRFEEANEAYDDASARYVVLARNDSNHQLAVAKIHQAIGAMHEQREHMQIAKEEYAKALATLMEMPESDESQFELARTHYLLAKEVSIEGSPRRRNANENKNVDARFAHLTSAIDLLTTLRAGNPDHAEYRFLLALCIREAERSGDVVERESVELLRELVSQFPAIQRYRFELCETYRSFGDHSLGLEERLADLHRARELAEQLVKEQRDAAAYRINLAHIYAFLGVAYGNQGNTRKAESYTRRSMATHASVVEDFPGLATLSDRLSKNDKLRLGRWLSQLQRYEELVELLQPLGDQLFEQANVHSVEPTASVDEPPNESISTLQECRDMLLPAYAALDDDVGYLVALAWLPDAVRRESPAGPPPRFGPPGAGLRNVPPVGEHATRFGPVEMALSYDTNGDDRIKREEVPRRMSQEWFSRMDANNDGEVDRDELAQLEQF